MFGDGSGFDADETDNFLPNRTQAYEDDDLYNEADTTIRPSTALDGLHGLSLLSSSNEPSVVNTQHPSFHPQPESRTQSNPSESNVDLVPSSSSGTRGTQIDQQELHRHLLVPTHQVSAYLFA